MSADIPADNPAGDAKSPPRNRRTVGLGAVLTAAFFGLFYAYDLWEAIDSLLELPGYYHSIGLSPADVPWGLLVAGVASPIIAYIAALVVARRQRFFARSIILFVGLAVVAAGSLAIIDLGSLLRP